MAEPSGEYRVHCSLDLSPHFGKLETKNTITLTRPPKNILDLRLAELNSGDKEVRLTAASDLHFFTDHGDRVFPALISLLEDPDEDIRMEALYAMGGYPDQIRDHMDLYLKIVNNRDESEDLVDNAAYWIGRFASRDDRVEKALEDGAAAYSESYLGESMVRALEQYRKRVNRPDS